MRQVGAEMRADPLHAPRILAELEIAGVERWDDSAVVIRARFRVAPLEQWTVKRDLLRRLKRAFDEQGIEIPFPQMKLWMPPVPPSATPGADAAASSESPAALPAASPRHPVESPPAPRPA